MNRYVLAVFVAGLVGAIVVPGAFAASSDDPLKFGLVVNSQGWGDKVGQQQDHAVALGVTHIREEIEWAKVSPAQGTWSWSHYDRLFEEAAKRGLTVLPILWATPDWAGTRGKTGPPTDTSTFAEYVRRTVARYGPNGSFWAGRPELAKYAPTNFELWNEPYFSFFFGGQYDPATYARLFRAGSIAGKQTDAGVRFLLPVEHTGRQIGSRWVPWIEELYAAVPDLGAHFDGVAAHPYSNDLATWATDSRQHTLFRRVEYLRALLGAHGDGDKPFWLTEIGWSTCDPAADSRCVTEQGQAQMFDQLFGLISTQYPWIKAAFVYHINNWGAPEDHSDRENWFGLLRHDGSRKPAWNVVHNWATRGLVPGRDPIAAPDPIHAPSPDPAPAPTPAPIPGVHPNPAPALAAPTVPEPPPAGTSNDRALAHPAKLEIARARVLRADRMLDLLAPISRRASGDVDVDFHAAGRRTTFEAPVDGERGHVHVKRSIPATQARMATGILTLRYAGDANTQPQEVRLRAASRGAKLEVRPPKLDADAGVVTTRGTVTARAHGVVRLQLVWLTEGQTRTVEFHARIDEGRFAFAEELSPEVMDSIARREGTLHSYALFTGYFKARIRGEMEAYQVLGAR